MNESCFWRILRYQLLTKPIDEFVTPPQTQCVRRSGPWLAFEQIPSCRLFLPRRYESWPQCFRPTNPPIRVELTLYLPHELPTDLMLRYYLRDTSPPLVKLLVMEVRLCTKRASSPSHSAYLGGNTPPTHSARHHTSEQKRADPARLHHSPTCLVEGGCAACTGGSIGARYIAQCR